jgi:hypothetical protein
MLDLMGIPGLHDFECGATRMMYFRLLVRLVVWIADTMVKIQLFLSLLIIPFTCLMSQERILRYNILHNGEIKGSLLLDENTTGNTIHIKIQSIVRTRFFIRINVESIEEAIFQDGILIYSSLRRTVNGSERVNQQLKAKGVSYTITSGDKTNRLPVYPIYYSILSLYYKEPVNINRVYSDNFQQYVDISRADYNKYKIIFPNGNYNYYTYMNGTCTTVDINQPYYSIQFQLNP